MTDFRLLIGLWVFLEAVFSDAQRVKPKHWDALRATFWEVSPEFAEWDQARKR